MRRLCHSFSSTGSNIGPRLWKAKAVLLFALFLLVVIGSRSTSRAAGGNSSTTTTTGGFPATPTNFVGTPGDTQVVLTWTSSESGFQVWRSTTSATTGFGNSPIATPTTTSYTDTGRTNNTHYWYKVRATNDVGQFSGYTPVVECIPLTHPTSLTATPTTDTITLNWTAGAGDQTYEVLRGTSSGTETSFGHSGITGTSFADTVVAGTTYYYVVRGNNSTTTSTGTSANSNEVHTMCKPEAPTLSGTEGDGTDSLSWTSVTGATSYILERGDAHNGPYTQIASGLTTPPYADNGLTNGHDYYYIIKAADSAGWSGASNEVHLLPVGKPTGLTATAGTSTVALSWTGSAGATSYTVLRGTASGGPYGTTVSSGSSSTSCSDTSGPPANGTTYYYVVQGVNSTGNSGNSSQASATPIAAPTGLTATAGNGQVSLSWTAVTGATSYTIKRGTSSNGETTLGTSATNSFVDSPATNGTTYYYKVCATNTVGTSDDSSEVSATPVGVDIGINLKSAISSHDSLNNTGISVVAGPRGYKWIRCAIGIDSYGNTARPLQNSPSIKSIIDEAVAANLSGVILLMNANPKLNGSYVLGLNSNVAWHTQTRPPSTVDPWILQCWEDARDAAQAEAVADGKDASFIVFELFNEQGKGGNQGPVCIGPTTITSGATSTTQAVGTTAGMNVGDTLHFATANVDRTVSTITDTTHVVLSSSVTSTTGETVTDTTIGAAVDADGKLYEPAYFGTDDGTIEDAWVTRMANLAASFDPLGSKVIGLALENEEDDSDSDAGGNDADVEINSLINATNISTFLAHMDYMDFHCYGRSTNGGVYSQSIWQSAYATKVAAGVTRVRELTSKPIWMDEFGWSTSQGPTDGTDIQTVRNDAIQTVEKAQGISVALLYTAFDDTNFFTYNDDGTALRGIVVMP